MTTDYNKLKVAELKDLVKERGIPQTGLKVKQQLIEALETQDTEDGGDNVGAVDDTAAEAGEAAGSGATEPATTEEADVTDAPAPQDSEANGGDEPGKDDSDLSNKRKRSPTPELLEESGSKKLKSAGEHSGHVKLPEDVVAEAPAPVDTQAAAHEKIVPYDSSDAVRDVKHATRDTQQTSDAAPNEWSNHFIEHEDHPPSGNRPTAADEDTAAEPASRHPRTRALYIRELLRPLQPNVLRQHLESIAQPADSSTSASIEAFHLDKIRTHAFVLFDSASAAARVRAALHNNKWPDEPMRKPLWVDYVPEDKIQEWIDVEVNRGDNTRWEIVYESTGMDTDSGVTASLQESDARPSAGRQPSTNSAAPQGPPGATGEGMPNAPSGPRQRSGQIQEPARPAPPPQRAPENRTFDSLDQRYSFTETKPKLYYQPVPGDLAQRRLDDLAAITSRDWSDRDADPSNYAEGELYRYTFEDGDRLVDGGADFGLFGRRGRGGGFGPRGDRGGRGRGRGGGDSYRGGGRRPYA